MERLFTLTQAAVASGYSAWYLRKLCREKKVAHTVRGSRYCFTATEIEGLAQHVPAAIDQVAQIEKAEIEKEQKKARAAGLLGKKHRKPGPRGA